MVVTDELRNEARLEPIRLAHDLNNDLAVIVGRCDLLGKMLIPGGDAARHLQLIQEAAHRMASRIAGRQLR